MNETHLDTFMEVLAKSVAARTFVKLTLGKYRGSEAGLKNIYVRLVEVKKREHLSFLTRYQTRDIVKNHLIPDALETLRVLLGESFLSGHLFTLEGDFQIEFNRKREARLLSRAATFNETPPATLEKSKRRHIELTGNVYLRALGVTNERDEIREKMGDKFRQINKFVEIVSGLFADSTMADKSEISIVDMGSGKGYLTFAIYDYFNRILKIKARVTGVEAREELVRLCNDIAQRAAFDQLSFRTGHIESFEVDAADILIALHACDTATDDAIYKGIAANASIIITAPCCHHELRPQIKAPAALRSVLKHGIFLERQAEMLTDAIRALLLEEAGYATKVFEFISTEHTAKNTMIVGVKREGRSDGKASADKIRELKIFYGVEEQRLEKHLRASRNLHTHESES